MNGECSQNRYTEAGSRRYNSPSSQARTSEVRVEHANDDNSVLSLSPAGQWLSHSSVCRGTWTVAIYQSDKYQFQGLEAGVRR